MNYIEIKLLIEPNEAYVADILAARLGEIGFESFENTDQGLLAYINQVNFVEKDFLQMIDSFEYASKIQYESKEVEQVNWNEEWEKHFFEPILIEDECLIHSSFHVDLSDAKYNILIDPKMSFGTGHHETTSLMVAAILKMELAGKTVLDMGCGTAVLAILAAKRGAGKVTAIDIDTWCVENSVENIRKNQVSDIDVMLGDAALLAGKKYNIIIANINRNILLNDMKMYAACMDDGDTLYMSGFYVADIPAIEEEAKKHNLSLVSCNQKNNWAIVHTVKTT